MDSGRECKVEWQAREEGEVPGQAGAGFAHEGFPQFSIFHNIEFFQKKIQIIILFFYNFYFN